MVTLLMLAQAALLYSSIRPEAVPAARPLAQIPSALGSWRLTEEGTVDEDTQAVLKADDLLNRMYAQPNGTTVNLFVAAFRSQRNGKAPHSPKNCLPGSGWTPLTSDRIPVDVGLSAPIVVNRYVIEHGDQRSVVLYWYQSRERVVASEYAAKFWVMYDAVRLNRTDTALVRVIVPMPDRDQEAGTRKATDFVKSFYGTLREYLPA